jgi:hypothetical protein
MNTLNISIIITALIIGVLAWRMNDPRLQDTEYDTDLFGPRGLYAMAIVITVILWMSFAVLYGK